MTFVALLLGLMLSAPTKASSAELWMPVIGDGQVGVPVFVKLNISQPYGSRGSTVLLVGAKQWTERIRLELIGPEGKKLDQQPWRARGTAPKATILLEKENLWLEWVLDPAASAKLQPGKYRLRAVLDNRSGRRGWRGVADFERELWVREEPQRPTDRAIFLETWIEYYERWDGPAPVEMLDLYDRAYPGTHLAAYFRARVYERQGRLQEALQLYQQAHAINTRPQRGGCGTQERDFAGDVQRVTEKLAAK